MKLIDVSSGKTIANMIAEHGTSLDDAIYLNNLKECIVDISTLEKGYRDEDGDEHYVTDLAIVND